MGGLQVAGGDSDMTVKNFFSPSGTLKASDFGSQDFDATLKQTLPRKKHVDLFLFRNL